MESKLKKPWLSRVFRSSCSSSSASSIKASDIATEPIFVSRRHFEPLGRCESFPSHKTLIERSVSVDCGCRRPSWSDDHFIKNKKKEKDRRRLLGLNAFFESGDGEGRTCPPASPLSPHHNHFDRAMGMKREVKNNKKKKLLRNPYGFSSSSSEGGGREGGGFFSSCEEAMGEEETENFFSSKSFSSDSSEFYRPNRRKSKKKMKKKKQGKPTNMDFKPLVSLSSPTVKRERVGESFAVVKKSRDPYEDFRDSMVEMIVEKKLFSGKDLEQLLHCFLSLNSPRHHRVIVQVFSDVWEALFVN
ncbi:hypothetical protein QJS10_CPB18g01188 [Acorus calamus]|uniref:Transcription repressor n=1 Tax=Acorus calamus TaxID=4465 RepID=A0AAV9CN60_ACOCL|nr:hypothetical protein QJS10_CPB18g01188 [Acorus calamus]